MFVTRKLKRKYRKKSHNHTNAHPTPKLYDLRQPSEAGMVYVDKYILIHFSPSYTTGLAEHV